MFSFMKFQGQWRDYQQRVLEELQAHLSDTKLHIVAAPGSGKTVLGLEVMRELGKPALLLSPSLTIRNQWSERLFEMFVPPGTPDISAMSHDLKNPALITSVTYQALHALWKVEAPHGEHADEDGPRRPDFARLVESLSGAAGITIIVDEAHHLRREWWRALNALVEALPEATLVALTATPPYDASHAEWSRYDNLCGPIDAEISVPELVRNGDLCPHQDYIHFSLPQRDERTLLADRQRGIAAFLSQWLADDDFIGSLAAHPWITQPETHEEDLLSDPAFLSSMLILMASADVPLPRAPLDLLGVAKADIPLLSPQWLQVFLNGFLFDHRETFAQSAGAQKAMERQLRSLGLVEGKRVKLIESRKLFKAMAGSLAKLDSITAIAAAERQTLADDLRMVVLTDYVRAADLPRTEGQPFRPAKLGVVPIFEALRRSKPGTARIGVLTGSLVIIPDAAKTGLVAAATAARIAPDAIALTALPGCPGYSQLQVGGNSNQKTVRLVTQLFNRGAIRILVGTQALLGEGWDAPTINTLVLASNVGSYMLSNQMRGRAIRIDRSAPDKVANIWHLATVEPQADRLLPLPVSRFVWDMSGATDQSGLQKLGCDMRLLAKRFAMFDGIAHGASQVIGNGIDRLDIPSENWGEEEVADQNALMLSRARDRPDTARKWADSLGSAHERSHVHKIAEPNYAPRGGSYDQTLRYLAINAIIGGFASAAGALRQFQSVREIATLLLIFGGLTLLYSVPKLVLAMRLLVKNGTLERSLRQVCDVLLKSLDHVQALKSPLDSYRIEIEPSLRGHHTIILHGASRAEERLFLDALAEILGPIENPRYLLIRKSRLGWFRRQDYHAVPALLGAHKNNAAYFARCWTSQIGPVKPIFTRQREGRKRLLQARAQSMAAGFQRRVDRRSQWR